VEKKKRNIKRKNIKGGVIMEKRYNKYIQKETMTKILYSDKDTKKTSRRLFDCSHAYNHFIKIKHDNKTVDIKVRNIQDKNGNNKVYKHFSNLIKCGSSMLCPICSARLSQGKGEQIKDLMEQVYEKKHMGFFIVLTVKHSSKDSLEETYERLYNIYRLMLKSRQWKNIADANQFETVSRGLEITISIDKEKKNINYHPHFNLLITSPKVEENRSIQDNLELSKEIYEIYNKLYMKYYGDSLLVPYFSEKEDKVIIKGSVVVSHNFKPEYLTKWGIDSELTSHSFKEGDTKKLTGLHPFQLLDIYNSEEIEISFKLFLKSKIIEYAKFVKGKRFFTLSPKLKKIYDIKSLKLTDEEILNEQEKMGDMFLEIMLVDWVEAKLTGKEKQELLLLKEKKESYDYIYKKIIEKLDKE
jgi:hypothetical protein